MGKPHYEISADHKVAKCNKCDADIYWVKTKNGKNMPCNADGFSHFETCPNASDYSGQSRKAESADKKEQKYAGEVATSSEIQELRDAVGTCMQVIDDLVKDEKKKHEKLRKWATGMEKRMKKQEGGPDG